MRAAKSKLPCRRCNNSAGRVALRCGVAVTLSRMPRFGRLDRLILEDSVRTALAGVGSYLIARMLGMSEAYWATFSALIVTQSTLGAAATISWQRLAATFLGAGMGAVLGSYFHAN